MVLPELGGRIHVLQDKTNGYDLIYHQAVIKPALVGLAGPSASHTSDLVKALSFASPTPEIVDSSSSGVTARKKPSKPGSSYTSER